MIIETKDEKGNIHKMNSEKAKKEFPDLRDYIEFLESIAEGTKNHTVKI